ncbi:hypothetical protein ACNJKD_01845 [Edwardsiella tarda]|uniref:hypothetical protein n=1 Tax=Edwardsiella tarda TaxID=636 RepID=UPI003A875F3D
MAAMAAFGVMMNKVDKQALRDIAIEYHGTQQLRERIARACRAAMLKSSGE